MAEVLVTPGRMSGTPPPQGTSCGMGPCVCHTMFQPINLARGVVSKVDIVSQPTEGIMAVYNLVTRAQWNARPPEKIVPFTWNNVTQFIVHYSGASRDQTVRSIQNFCMDVKDHSDIDYNDLVRDSDRYIGRGVNVGSHILNQNSISYGVCVIGENGDATDADFRTVRAIYDELTIQLGRQLKALGHRQAMPPGYTDCPGDEIQAWVSAGMPIEGVTVDQKDVIDIWEHYLARNGMNLVDNLGTSTANTAVALSKLDEIKALLANGAAGLTEEQVRAIVREELDNTRLAG